MKSSAFLKKKRTWWKFICTAIDPIHSASKPVEGIVYFSYINPVSNPLKIHFVETSTGFWIFNFLQASFPQSKSQILHSEGEINRPYSNLGTWFSLV